MSAKEFAAKQALLDKRVNQLLSDVDVKVVKPNRPFSQILTEAPDSENVIVNAEASNLLKKNIVVSQVAGSKISRRGEKENTPVEQNQHQTPSNMKCGSFENTAAEKFGVRTEQLPIVSKRFPIGDDSSGSKTVAGLSNSQSVVKENVLTPTKSKRVDDASQAPPSKLIAEWEQKITKATDSSSVSVSFTPTPGPKSVSKSSNSNGVPASVVSGSRKSMYANLPDTEKTTPVVKAGKDVNLTGSSIVSKRATIHVEALDNDGADGQKVKPKLAELQKALLNQLQDGWRENEISESIRRRKEEDMKVVMKRWEQGVLKSEPTVESVAPVANAVPPVSKAVAPTIVATTTPVATQEHLHKTGSRTPVRVLPSPTKLTTIEHKSPAAAVRSDVFGKLQTDLVSHGYRMEKAGMLVTTFSPPKPQPSVTTPTANYQRQLTVLKSATPQQALANTAVTFQCEAKPPSVDFEPQDKVTVKSEIRIEPKAVRQLPREVLESLDTSTADEETYMSEQAETDDDMSNLTADDDELEPRTSEPIRKDSNRAVKSHKSGSQLSNSFEYRDSLERKRRASSLSPGTDKQFDADEDDLSDSLSVDTDSGSSSESELSVPTTVAAGGKSVRFCDSRRMSDSDDTSYWSMATGSDHVAARSAAPPKSTPLMCSTILSEPTSSADESALPVNSSAEVLKEQQRRQDASEQAVKGAAVKRDIDRLTELAFLEERKIEQASKALNQAQQTQLGSGKTALGGSSLEAAQIKSHEVLLVATQRRKAFLAEIDRLRQQADALRRGVAQSGDAQHASVAKGQLVVESIELPLKREFMDRIGTAHDQAVHHFVCLLRYGADVLFTQSASSHDARSLNSGKVSFPNRIMFPEVAGDFRVLFEVYSMTVARQDVDAQRTPAKKRKKMAFNAYQSPAGPYAVHTSNFALVSSFVLSADNAKHERFALKKVPNSCPLLGEAVLKIGCYLEIDISERGFLTMFQEVKGLGAWHRRWFVLQNGVLVYWKYPEEEEDGKAPIGRLSLKRCISRQVEPVSRYDCARANTLALVIAEAGGAETTYLLSADSKEERDVWCHKLTACLRNLRVWCADALKPPDAPSA